MRRKIYDQLLHWRNGPGKKPAILVEGARRVGKSYIVEEFARQEYDSYLLIDFGNTTQDVRELFDRQLHDLDTFFLYLSGLYNIALVPGHTLIVFDEVQLFPRARAAIKYLVQDGRFDYVETGSLMSIRKNTEGILIPSEERRLPMYPMDFEEFLWARGNDTLMPIIRRAFESKIGLGVMHRKAMELFRQYLVIGGMPQAVAAFSEGASFQDVDQRKRDILALYREDMARHARGYESKVASIFDDIPSQLQQHEKKFQLSSLEPDARFRDYENALFWLTDAMIVNMCFGATAPTVGLRLNKDRLRMKCYMGDTGLLVSHAFDEQAIVDENLYQKLLFGKLEVNSGMIFENAVAQMLAASGHKLYFYSNSSREKPADRMEIDFLVPKHQLTNRHNISPIEVKSSKKNRLTSLHKFVSKFGQQSATPYVIHTGDFRADEDATFLPVYMTPLL